MKKTKARKSRHKAKPADSSRRNGETPCEIAANPSGIRFVTNEEVAVALDKILPKFAEVFRRLAQGPEACPAATGVSK